MNWTDIEDIAIELEEAHPKVDPLAVRFTELRKLVEGLDDFDDDPDRRVNEQILEAIQAAWIEERQDADRRASDEEDDDRERSYRPNDPFR